MIYVICDARTSRIEYITRQVKKSQYSDVLKCIFKGALQLFRFGHIYSSFIRLTSWNNTR